MFHLRPSLSNRPAGLESLEARRLLAAIAVDTLNDVADPNDGVTSLREAITLAADASLYPGADTIDLTGLGGTINLTAPLTIGSELTLDGPGADTLTINGRGNGLSGRVLLHDAGELTVRNLALRGQANGSANAWGAVYNGGGAGYGVTFDRVDIHDSIGNGGVVLGGGDVTLIDSTLRNSYITDRGAILRAGGHLTIDRSSVINNAHHKFNGSTPTDGFLYAGDGATIVNSTVANNITRNFFKPNDPNVWIRSLGGRDTTITGSTFANNHVDGNHGAQAYRIEFVSGAASSKTLTVADNLIAGDVDRDGGVLHLDLRADAAKVTFEHNLVAEGVAGTYDANGGAAAPVAPAYGVDGNLVGTNLTPIDPKLDTLGDHGGPTPTYSLLATSPAINRGSASASADDQRGTPRTGNADIGAHESAETNTAPTLLPVPGELPPVVPGQAYSATLAAGDLDLGDTLTFASTDLPSWLTLTDHGDRTATLAGTAPAAVPAADREPFTVTVGDGTVDVDHALRFNNAPPALAAGTPPKLVPGAAYSATFTATDTDADDTLTLTATGLPAWLTFADNGDRTATVSGTVPARSAATADVDFTLAVNDGKVTVVTPVTLEQTPNSLPSLAAPASVPMAVPGVPYELTFTATDGDALDVMAFSAAGLPSWLGLTSDGRTATLAGTPPLAASADDVTVTVSDGAATEDADVTVQVGLRIASVVDGELSVLGTPGDNVIEVRQVRDKVRATRDGRHRYFDLADVRSVRVVGQGGDDTANILYGRLGIFDLGDGADKVRGTADSHHVFAGGGDDTIDLPRGRNIVFAGDGNDTVNGGSGYDKIFGEAGSDRISTGGGRNYARGGGGDDVLIGGNSADRLYGDAGDDTLFGRGGTDRIFGGADFDTAFRRGPDVFTDVEDIV